MIVVLTCMYKRSHVSSNNNILILKRNIFYQPEINLPSVCCSCLDQNDTSELKEHTSVNLLIVIVENVTVSGEPILFDQPHREMKMAALSNSLCNYVYDNSKIGCGEEDLPVW